ncbi:tetratricopeptide repeat protein [Streptomyces sp. NBC_01285]|uniref:caspase, EACC1-associated type n=1 Tax=Streptomyces sp. NBC_01285 TaxID=2903813 RepID=UPI00225686E5|nr:tetratricopeptide repeat protein [Streptomyces sp. NBC_01285]MCX4775134.1 caspase family protein [Streptomyces sp. NBC_01285]
MMRPPDPARSRAVLVGTAEYTEDALLPGVSAVRNNVRDLQRLLTEGRPGAFSTESTRTVLDPATPRDLGLPLLEAARQAEDVFLVYYAGHGLIGHERRELYLGLSKSVSEAPSFTAFPFQGIREAFLATPARNRVLILDCCFSGRAITGGLSGTYEPLIDQMEITGTYTLTSAAANEPARFQDGERHTAFTGELLLTLRDGIPTTSSAEVTLGALFRHLKRVLPAKGLPEPQQCGTDTAEFLILARPRLRARRGPVTETEVGGPPGAREGLLARWDLGRRRGEEGQTGEAMRLLNEVVPDLTRTLGPDDPVTLVGRINLAYWTGREGDTDEALRLSTAAVSDMTRVLGPHHRATLVGQSQLAHWMGESGRHHEALSRTTSVLTDLVRVLGPDDRETLIGRARLARWTGEASDPAAAARLTGELVPDLSRVLGAEDRETFTGRMNLAQWTGRAGGSKRAVRLLTDLVPDVSWALGPDDRHALLSRSRLAHWSGAAGRRRRARRLFAAAVPDLERVLGPDDRETLLARSQLAHWTGETGQAAEAVRIFGLLVSDIAWVLGSDDRATLVSRARLAHWTAVQGEVGDAIRQFHGVLPDLNRVLGPDAPETTENRVLLAFWRNKADRRLREQIFYGTGPHGGSP